MAVWDTLGEKGIIILAVFIITFIVISALILLFFIGLKKQPKSTLLALLGGFITGIIDVILQTQWLFFVGIVIGFLFGLIIFKKDKFDFLLGKGFEKFLKIASIVEIVIGVIILIMFIIFVINNLYIETINIIYTFFIIGSPLFIGVLGLFWGYK